MAPAKESSGKVFPYFISSFHTNQHTNPDSTMKPKLLLVADTYYPKVDGTLRFMEEFINQASEAFDISLLVPQFNGSAEKKGVTFLSTWKWFSLSGYPSIALSWKNLKRIKVAIQKADIIFIQGPALLSYLAMYYGQKFQKKTIAYLHVISWELFAKFMPKLFHHGTSHLIKRVSLFFYNHCSQVFVPYEQLEQQLREEGLTVPIKIAQLGVDIHRFVPSLHKEQSKEKIGIPPDTFVIGYVGRISREKNTEALLQAFRQLPQQDHLQLLLVGDGLPDQTKSCQELTNCQVTGFVTGVEKYLQAMDVFVMPSLTETTSLSTLEAMATGLPVIVTPVGFLKEYIEKGVNGLFFPRKSPTMLALKIEHLKGKKRLRLELGMNARKTIVSRFSWEQSLARIKHLLLS